MVGKLVRGVQENVSKMRAPRNEEHPIRRGGTGDVTARWGLMRAHV